METFTWIPDFSSTFQETPSVSAVKFGDGYEQRQATGLNPLIRTPQLTFSNRDTSEYSALLAFLRARGGVEAFLFTPPGETDAFVFVCRQWTSTPVKQNLWTIQANFDEVYEPS